MNKPWLHRFALLTAFATLGLIGIGGLVTSRGVGMAVPDWPTTYGYNMFLFPISQWVGGIFYEHTHRLWASIVGVLVVGLTRWLGGRTSRLPLAIVGLTEILAGLALLGLGPAWHGAGHFLTGIGGVVLVSAAIWARNGPAARPLPALGWLAFATVQVQGLLGGLRVVLFKDDLGIVHAALAQIFLVLVCAIALLTSRWWKEGEAKGQSKDCHELCVHEAHLSPIERTDPSPRPSPLLKGRGGIFASSSAQAGSWKSARGGYLRSALLATTFIILFQLLIGATMRHQHAGLAIPDFPSAYGKLWPAMDPQSVARYNQQRLETTAVNPIAAFQIGLQMAHRILAAVILGAVAFCAWCARRELGAQSFLAKWSLAWLGLVLSQAVLGAATIWSNKAADVATLHVLVGALSLVTGAMLSIISFRTAVFAQRVPEPATAAHQVAASAFHPQPSAANKVMQ